MAGKRAVCVETPQGPGLEAKKRIIGLYNYQEMSMGDIRKGSRIRLW